MKKIFCLLLCCLYALMMLAGCESKEKKEARERAEQIAQYRSNKTEIYLAENEQYGDYEVDVAFLGDSLTDLYDLQSHYPQFLVSNRGIGGDTTLDLEGRLQVSLYDLKPKVAVMLIGANNPKTMLENYESILRGFREHVPDTRIVLLSMTSMGSDWAIYNPYAEENNIRIRQLADSYGFAFVDLYFPMQDPKTGEIRPEYVLDGAHFTEEGYEVLTALITPVITEQLELWHQEHP